MTETPPPPRRPRPPGSRPRTLVVVAIGATAVAAVLAVGVAASVLLLHPKRAPTAAADHGMLQVEMGKGGEDKLDPAKPLRCFVGGQFVGQATLADCAAKNGVSAQNLDVGLDPSGQVAAQGGAAEPLAPLPQPEQTVASNDAGPVTRNTPAVTPDDDGSSAAGGAGACLRFTNGGWRGAGAGAGSLHACVHELYEDRCVHPGEALYGRYGQQTLRLVPGRVEISDDNRRFRFLTGQDPDACSLED